MIEEEMDSQKAQSVFQAKENGFGLDVTEMTKAGMHFGQRTSRTHPKMLPYIFGVRNSIHIIDLEKTLPKFSEALAFIKTLTEDGKIIMFVGTKPPIKSLIRETATDCSMPYVVERWLGGTITNWPIISKRIEYFKELERKKKEGELEKYTKKERLQIDKELKTLEEKFQGIKELPRLPDAIFLSDLKKDEGALKEARLKRIPTIAICDTNVDPTLVDFPIPANDDAISSIKYVLEKIKEVWLKNKA